jgi:hypothetical protein
MLRWVASLAALLILAPACGPVEEDETVELVDVGTLEGFDQAADYAGGRYVAVKGALTRGRSKTGEIGGRTAAVGYTLTAKRGEQLQVRGVAKDRWAIVSIYGPKAADGSWGLLRAKEWTTFPYERGIPFVRYRAAAAGQYLVIIGTNRGGTPVPFALTACGAECVAKACAEWTNTDSSAFWAGNFLTTAEAALVPWSIDASPAVRSGACSAQSRSCGRTRAPVCSGERTYDNVCRARVAQRDAMNPENFSISYIAPTAGACAR